MTCRDVEALLITYASGASVPPEAVAHIAGCERCRSLIRALQQPVAAGPPAERWRSIEDRIVADLRPVRPLVSGGVRSSILILMLALVALAGAAVLGIAGWHGLSLLQRASVFTALAAAAGLLSFSLGRQMAPGAGLLLSPYSLIAAVFVLMTGVFAILFQPHPEAAFVATGLVCLRIGVECALAAALLFWLLMRQGAILNPLLTGATAGALAGLAGLTVLELFCPNPNAHHILVWHLGALLTSIAAGTALGGFLEHSDRRH